MKKIFALVLAMLLVLGMTSAFAVSITVKRDSSYDSEASGNRSYKYYKVFDAEYNSAASDGVSYTLPSNSALVAKLGTWSDSTGFTAANNQIWFTLTKTADGTKYIVGKTDQLTESTAQDAAAWLLATGVLGDGVALTLNNTQDPVTWSANDLDKGYYIVEGSSGKNLIAATTDISINEKNKYPPINKEQKKANGTWTENPLPEELYKPIYYKLTIDVPADANKAIAVVDTMTKGLTYNNDLATHAETETGAAVAYTTMTSADKEYNDGSALTDGAAITFQIKFSDATVTSMAGKKIIITYSATVNEQALVDTGKENDVTLYYDEGNYQIPDHANYEIYTTGAVKYDGATADVNANTNALVPKDNKDIAYLKGAEFKLQVQYNKTGNWADLPVVKNTDGTYRPASSTETGVAIASNDNGEIIIRGLDKSNNYKLIETKAPDGGYNLLSTEAALNVSTKDEKEKVALKPADAANPASDTTYIDSAATELSTKIANNKGNELPSTGGIGTTLFYVGGGILVLAAVILLVTKRRMSAND